MTRDDLGAWTARLASATAAIGRRVEVDGASLLTERRRLDGDRPSATRVLRCADGWAAVTLAREWDRASAPAWLGVEGTWEAITPAVATRSAAELAEAAELFGLAIGVLGEREAGAVVATGFGEVAEPSEPGASDAGSLRVVDLSALWAGPLCAALLAEAGADVVKVESTARPDASRAGNPGLFQRLNGAKRSVVVDLGSPEGRSRLAALVEAADVVVESSRPRALEQLGVVAAELLAAAAGGGPGPRVWVSITGHGRASNRVAFGDDAAVAGGLVTWDGDRPGLWGDAAADPLTGLVAATAAAEALAAGERVLLDVALAGVAAELAPTIPPDLPAVVAAATGSAPPTSGDGGGAVEPGGPSVARRAGADTDEVLTEWIG